MSHVVNKFAVEFGAEDASEVNSRRLWEEEGWRALISFNPEQKTGRDVSDRILLDCTTYGPFQNEK